NPGLAELGLLRLLAEEDLKKKMNNSVSDRSFYIESEDEEDEEKEFNKSIEDGGNDSDSSESYTENQQQNIPSSYNTQWPQSYRQSIDLYSSVPSPGIGFLGTPSLSRLGSSFLSSSLTRRHTPETLPFLTKPSVPIVADEQQQQQQQRRSSHSLLPPIHSRRSSIRKDDKPSRVSHEHHPISRHSSFTQAVINGINVLCGVGILSTPYAIKEGGWLGLSILLIFAVLSFYTGLLLRRCLDSQPGLETYPDIGQAAFGTGGRIAISIILYVELYACCIEYIILESDNLSSLFPNAHLSLGGYMLDSRILFAILTTLAVLPTVWLRDLSVLSYISAGGVIASIVVVLCLFWVGLVDGVGFENKGTPLNLSTLPVAMGLYGYCYSGHAFCDLHYFVWWSCCHGVHNVWGINSVTVHSQHASRFGCLQDCSVDYDLDTSLCLLSEYPGRASNSASGVVSSSFGTYSAVSKIVQSLIH
ncbi:Transmembrane amino acid transporter family protein, partial [Prunus dulcis]